MDENNPDVQENSNEESSDLAIEQTTEEQPQSLDSSESQERPEWLSEKYLTNDRSIDEAIAEQAKAYNEAQKKLRSVDVPESYDLEIPEDSKIDKEALDQFKTSKMFEAITSSAKEAKIPQKAFNDVMVKALAAEAEQLAEQRESYAKEQEKLLGENSKERIGQISNWAKNNLDENEYEVFANMTTSAAAVELFEKIRSMAIKSNVPGKVGEPVYTAINYLEEARKMNADKKTHQSAELTKKMNEYYKLGVQQKNKNY